MKNELSTVLKLTTSLNENIIKDLKAGDIVELSGEVYTARDSAHKKIVDLLDHGQELPFNLKGSIIYYVGPTPAKPGKAVGSAGPTTSTRMDKYTPILLDKGLKAMIGKGNRSEEVIDSMIRNNAVYFAATGGAAALISRSIIKSELIAYPELGPEAICKFTIKNMPLIVAIDSKGNSLYV